MITGRYYRNRNDLNNIKICNRNENFIVCGDYGCPQILSDTDYLLKLSDKVKNSNKELYYISPKTNEANIDKESEKIIKLLTENIMVSVNDLGILYRINNRMTDVKRLYLGRLLVKSITNWAWSDSILAEESEKNLKYLSQCSFLQDSKMEYFKTLGIKGIEVNVCRRSEPSYKKIKSQGFEVIGFSDYKVLSVSRCCPVAKLKGSNVSDENCNENCMLEYKVIPVEQRLKGIYPDMHLVGNVVYQTNNEKADFEGYNRIVYHDL